MIDGTQKRIDDIEIGDKIFGVKLNGEHYEYVEATVENKWYVTKKTQLIRLANNTELVCSESHRWLCDDGWKYTLDAKGIESREHLEVGNCMVGIDEGQSVKVGDTVNADNSKRRIESINEFYEVELVDITTSTGNFVANGIVSHNCYAKSLLDFRGLWNPLDPAVADIKKIESKIKKVPKGTILRLGGMTDCFQACEKQYGVTYETIKLLNMYGIGYLIVTKSDLVADDKYMEIMDKDLAHIQITVTCVDDDFYLKKKYEKAPLPSKRIAAIKKLQDAGFDVAIRLSPLMEEYMDFDKLNSLGIEKCVVEFLRINHWIMKWFDVDFKKYVIKESGYRHLPLDEKMRIIEKVKIPQKTVCEDVTNHYLHWIKYVNPNKNDCCNLRIKDGEG